MTQNTLLICCCPIIGLRSPAQNGGIKGVITDTAARKNLQYAIVALLDKKDSSLVNSTRSDAAGNFLLEEIRPGHYTLLVTFPRMGDYLQEVTIAETVKTEAVKAETVKTMTDKTAGGTTAAGMTDLGEKVTKVFVDGDEFFSDDPTLATRYLEAHSVDKIQVYDRKSDQANFTGIDDGKHAKTINIQLKEDKKKGYFGKLSTGSNGKDFYNHEAMANDFMGKEKISVFGIASSTGETGLGYRIVVMRVGNMSTNEGITKKS